MVLLDILSKNPKHELVIAHYDHGIRDDSAEDRKIVEKARDKYGCVFEYEEGSLGPESNEANAREARYKFLRKQLKKHSADAIVAAHHQDDALETLLINIIRGTGRRGVLKETKEIKRPMLATTKAEIIEYAKANNINWREDSTNSDNRHLRNYVRNVLIPLMKKQDPESIDYLLDSSTSLSDANADIQEELDLIVEENTIVEESRVIIPRQWLIMLPNEVGREVLYEIARRLDKNIELSRKNIEAMLVFSKTSIPGKTHQLKKGVVVKSKKETISLELV